jgi:hypothetical protein
MGASKNRFDVQVVMPGIAFGIKNRRDVELTAEQVADELEKFCARIRGGGKVTKEWAADVRAAALEGKDENT